MRKSNLLSAVATLKPKEWTGFRKYLLMVTVEDSDNYRLYEALYKLKGKEEKLTDGPSIHQKSFDHLSEKGFLNMLSRVYGYLEDFWLWEDLQKQKLRKHALLVNLLNDRGLYEQANRAANRVIKEVEKSDSLSLERTYHVYLVYFGQYFSDNPIKYEKDGGELLESVVTSFLEYVKQHIMLYQVEMVNWGRITGFEFGKWIALIEQVILILPNSDSDESLLLLKRFVKDFDVEAYLSLKDYLKMGRFGKSGTLHTLIAYYLILKGMRLFSAGNIKLADHIVELYEYGLESRVLMKSGRLQITRLNNILSVLALFRSVEWGEKFIDRWSKYVIADQPNEVVPLANAINCFYHEEYSKMDDYLNICHPESKETKVRFLGLRLISAYMNRKKDYSFVHESLSNFKRTLKRLENKISKNTIEYYQNLIDVIEKLVKNDFTYVSINLSEYKRLIYRIWCQKEVAKLTTK